MIDWNTITEKLEWLNKERTYHLTDKTLKKLEY